MKLRRKRGLAFHMAMTALVAIAAWGLYLFLCSPPEGSVWIEAEGLSLEGHGWAYIDDVNFSGSRGVMSHDELSEAWTRVTVEKDGEYAIWIRYYGNYGKPDLALWKRAYTNRHKYLDYNGAEAPVGLSISVGNAPATAAVQEGSHEYRWARVLARLKGGEHEIRVSKAAGGAGSANLDGVLVTEDLSWKPRQILPRQASGLIAPVLLVAFGPLAWLLLRLKSGLRASVCIWYSLVLAAALSVMWIDTDGGFWIWLTQQKDFTASTIYTAGDALHHRYVYHPPVALLLIALRPVFTLFGAMDGITPASLLLSKLAVFPFVALTGWLLYRLAGAAGLVLWAFNPAVLFTAAANSHYFGLAFLLTLCVFAASKQRPFLSALFFGLALAYMSASALLLAPLLLLLRGSGPARALVMAALAIVPSFLVLLPYQFIDPAGLSARVTGAGLATWMSMHLGLMVGGVGVTALLYGGLLAYLWIRKPGYDHVTLSAVFALSGLIYLNIGAPYFLAWTVAFQPFIILLALRYGQASLYSLYITAMMLWGSFFLNTGGAENRAGETGFFPFYTFYTWPFDAFATLRAVYGKAHFFARADLEALSHSVSAGLSAALLLLIALKALARQRQ